MVNRRDPEGTISYNIGFTPLNEVSEVTDSVREEGPEARSLGASKKWTWSPMFFICCSQMLSSWGDRMWTFAVGLYLVEIETTLRLTAIFGLVLTISVLLFGSLVGSWVDKYPRIRVVKISLLIQNSCVVVCAAILAILLMVGVDTLKGHSSGWIYLICQILIIVFGDLANLAGMAEKISIQKDWVVVLAGKDKDLLAKMNSFIRGIDQVINILAPIATGVIMTYGSLFLGAICIGGWNLVSGFVEYYLLLRVYRLRPALSVKMSKEAEEMQRREDKRFTIGDDDSEDNGNEDLGDIGVSDDVQSRVALYSGSTEQDWENPDPEEEDADRLSLTPSEDERITRKVRSRPMLYRIAYDDEEYATDSDGEPSKASNQPEEPSATDTSAAQEQEEGPPAAGESHDPSPDTADRGFMADEDIPNLELRRVSRGQTCGWRLTRYFVDMYCGWITYVRYPVRFAGLALAFLYMTVLGFDSVTSGYIYSQGISEAYISLARGFGSVAGLLGVFVFPRLRQRAGLEHTGLWAIGQEILCLTLCVASVWLPGSPFDLSPSPVNTTTLLMTTPSLGGTTFLLSRQTTGYEPLSVTENSTSMLNLTETTLVALTSHATTPAVQTTGCSMLNSTVSPEPESEQSSISVVVLLTGMVLSRFGLWMFDLTVTQIQQENVMESERGVVNGVQSSLNNFMYMLQSILVICLPTPQTFGLLIILTFGFVFLGGCLYSYYSFKRGHLPLEKLLKKSDSYQLNV